MQEQVHAEAAAALTEQRQRRTLSRALWREGNTNNTIVPCAQLPLAQVPAHTGASLRTLIFQIFPVRTQAAAKQMHRFIFQHNLESLFCLSMFHKSTVAYRVSLISSSMGSLSFQTPLFSVLRLPSSACIRLCAGGAKLWAAHCPLTIFYKGQRRLEQGCCQLMPSRRSRPRK